MTTPTDMPMEARLRAHFADRARTMDIPGPEQDTALARAREGFPLEAADGDDELRRRRRLGRRGSMLLVAAVVVVLAVVTGVVLAGRDDHTGVSTDSTPGPTVPPTREPSPPTTDRETPTTTTMPPSPGSGPTGPFVAREGILGSWDGTSWVQWDAAEDAAPSARDYQVVGVGGSIGTVPGTPAAGCLPSGGSSVDVGFTWDSDPAPLAVAGAGELRPRPVEGLDAGAEVYRSAAAQVASDHGVAQPAPEVRQVVRADLDGDGTAEVLVVAEQRANSDPDRAEVGDWSVIFERRVVGGAVETTVLDWNRLDDAQEANPPAVEVYRLSAVADLNGDGRMEMAVMTRFWENVSTTVWESGPGARLSEVLRATCGV